jgi:hypothetical protein
MTRLSPRHSRGAFLCHCLDAFHRQAARVPDPPIQRDGQKNRTISPENTSPKSASEPCSFIRGNLGAPAVAKEMAPTSLWVRSGLRRGNGVVLALKGATRLLRSF